MKRLLVLTNGAGEDAIARLILSRLPQQTTASLACLPLVGPGNALRDQYELIGPRVLSPSEGLFRESWRLALSDLLQGVVLGHLRQLSFLRAKRYHFGLTVAVGDLFPVLIAGLAGLTPLLFIGTAKSVYHHPYSFFERLLLKKLARLSLVRDKATAERLSEQNVLAQCLGNAMMDELKPSGRVLPLNKHGPLLLLLPGSRTSACLTLPLQLEAAQLVRESLPELQIIIAAAPGTDPSQLCAPCLAQGFRLSLDCTGEGALGVLERDGYFIHILQGRLGDLLARASVALGQAGTANEQAAGAGVPVVAFDPREESRLSWYRARQKGLLGDAVKVVLPAAPQIANELKYLLTDPAERARRANIGQERMGPAGASQRIAGVIDKLWTS